MGNREHSEAGEQEVGEVDSQDRHLFSSAMWMPAYVRGPI